MSPKDHRHPEWEAQWRDTMADYQSGPATEQDWSAMSALLDGGGAAPPDPTPNAGAGGGMSWSFLKWLLPALVTTTLATAYWYAGAEGDQLTAEVFVDGDTEEVVVSETTRALQPNVTIPPAESTPEGIGAAASTEMAGISAGHSRRAAGKDRASRVRARQTITSAGVKAENPSVTTLKEEGGVAPGPPTEDNDGSTSEATVESSQNLSVGSSATSVTPNVPAARRPYRRIPRRMPLLLRENDPEKMWRKKIERQISRLRVTPSRPAKAPNGLYPRVRVRY
jgi:hypothetical protein